MNNLNSPKHLSAKFSPKRLSLFIIPALLMLSQLISAQIPTFYGTSAIGGSDSLGCIFKINGDGSGFDTVYSFHLTTGVEPLVMHMVYYNGKLYGTAASGGQDTAGVIFSFDPNTHAYTNLLDFNHTNGGSPDGGLTMAANKFYGMTSLGGANNLGLIFSFDPANSAFNDLFDFDSVNGSAPFGELLLSGGKLYGATPVGGQYNKGVLFSITTSGTFQKVVDFDSVKGWEPPYGGLADGGNGKLYGITYEGGSHNLGVIYTLNTTNNSFQKIYDFDSIHGASPGTGMVLAANNKLYGTTIQGGANNVGVIYSVDPSSNVVTKVHDFNAINDGTYAVGTIQLGSDNKLYSTAYQGGANAYGTMFSFDPSSNTFSKIHDCARIDADPAGALTEVGLNVGIASIADQGSITVSPNPVMDMAVLHLSSQLDSKYNLTVTDVTGKVVMLKENTTSAGEQNLSIDMSNFGAGVYVLNIATANGAQRQSLKVVKQ